MSERNGRRPDVLTEDGKPIVYITNDDPGRRMFCPFLGIGIGLEAGTPDEVLKGHLHSLAIYVVGEHFQRKERRVLAAEGDCIHRKLDGISPEEFDSQVEYISIAP
ncbi:MAG: hypothetical protein Q8P25_03930 [Candidatus Curtissbacteria bacterium]|nr:hypothetical protein [Candidatus Curtissbacteria bacterium]